ncbi:glycoside hydrolase family 2 protein [Dictyobacter kobayashii]|nr:glycoside hydrolase family 2 protein [Dictyobacter kobayashii]
MVDYHLRTKPAYYSVARELAPLVVGLDRQSVEQVAVWAVNGSVHEVQLELELCSVNLAGDLLSEQRRSVVLAPNRSSELDVIQQPQDDQVVLQARLWQDGKIVARTTLWSEPYKYLTLPDPELHVERVDSHTVTISAERPAKGVWLDAGSGVKWSDNMLDIIPGDPQTLTVSGLEDQPIQLRWLDK